MSAIAVNYEHQTLDDEMQTLTQEMSHRQDQETDSKNRRQEREADAVICIVPADTPVATLLLSIAIAVLPSDAHVNVMPFITLLNWSYPTAV